jgi:hypothetical protein
MSKRIIGLTIAALPLACGPRVDDEERPPGELVYEDSLDRLYRLDRRVEVIYDYERDDGLEGKCGILTDRAYDELESTLVALDPIVDYGYDPDVLDCERSQALVHIDGFEHSPFECGFSCCHRDLYWAVVVYTMALNNFDGGHPTIDGEPYVAIEPDVACP